MTDKPPVFVIDDEEPVRTSLAKLLRALGFPSETFASGELFLTSDRVGAKACLLVDIRMPGMSGLDLIEELNRRQTPMAAIVMTGHTDMGSLQRLETLKPLGFLEKPFSVTQLKAILEQWAATLGRP